MIDLLLIVVSSALIVEASKLLEHDDTNEVLQEFDNAMDGLRVLAESKSND